MAKIARQHQEFAYAAFHVQQSLEKALKGIYLLHTGNQPPYIHDLARLAELCHPFLPEIKKFDKIFTGLSPYYLSTRYPEYKESVSKALTDQRVDEFFETADEVLEWLNQKSKS